MRQNGAVSDLEGGVRLLHSDGRDSFEPIGSSFRPNWRESEAQLTEKQVVLLMHDTLPQGVKASALYYKRKFYNKHSEII